MNIIHTKAKAASDAIHSFGVSASNTLKNLRDRISMTVTEIFNQVKEYFFGRHITQITFQATDIMGEYTVPNFTSDAQQTRAAAIAAREKETTENKASEIEFEKRAAALKPFVQKLVEKELLHRSKEQKEPKLIRLYMKQTSNALKSSNLFLKRDMKKLYKARKEQLIAYEKQLIAYKKQKEQVENYALPIAFAASALAMGYFYAQNKQTVDESIQQHLNNISSGMNQLAETLPSAETIQRTFSNWTNSSIEAVSPYIPYITAIGKGVLTVGIFVPVGMMCAMLQEEHACGIRHHG
jgi:hypothetical protein